MKRSWFLCFRWVSCCFPPALRNPVRRKHPQQATGQAQRKAPCPGRRSQFLLRPVMKPPKAPPQKARCNRRSPQSRSRMLPRNSRSQQHRRCKIPRSRPSRRRKQQKQSLLKPHSPPNRQPSHRVRYLIPFIHRQTLSVSSRRSEPMRKAMRHRASALSGRTAWRFPRMSDTSGRRISGMKVWTVQSGVCSTMWIRSSKLPPIRPMV